MSAPRAAPVLPWQGRRRTASLVLLVPACALIGLAVHARLVPPAAYGVFFVLLFAWVGAFHPPGTALLVAPLIALGYVVPLTALDTPVPFDALALALTLAAGLLVAELIARSLQTSRAAQARAERVARTFQTVSRSSAELRSLEPFGVLDAVVDAVMDLEFDGADIAMLDLATGTFRPEHTRGLATALAGQWFPLAGSTTGRVLATGETVVTRDYVTGDLALEAVVKAGVGSTIAVPVRTNGMLVAVLHAMGRDELAVVAEDVDALHLLAKTAGTALETADLLRAERAAAQHHADEAVTDPLTGLPNRRYADRLIATLQPGDVVVLVDLDHFKDVNDRFGHQRGDEVLVDFARHVAAELRGSDTVCRFGGEEFLVVMPRTTLQAAVAGVNRLLRTWRRAAPLVTFSAGVARHEAGRERITTLGAADEALYVAKHEGRDRCRAARQEPAQAVPALPW